MNAYHAFALVYDRMMEEIPYEEWCNFVTDQLKKFGIEDGLMRARLWNRNVNRDV